MHKSRLEAFTDGVVAIIITIMVLEIKVPQGESWTALLPLWPKMLSYALSFVSVGIYWNNHHHTMQAVKSVNGAVLWANLHLLFWMSLIPFSTAWMGENHFVEQPMILYGANLLATGVAYYIWARTLIAHHGENSALARAFGKDIKGKISLTLYAIGIACTLVQPWLGFAMYVCVAFMWMIPDRRMHQAV